MLTLEMLEKQAQDLAAQRQQAVVALQNAQTHLARIEGAMQLNAGQIQIVKQNAAKLVSDIPNETERVAADIDRERAENLSASGQETQADIKAVLKGDNAEAHLEALKEQAD